MGYVSIGLLCISIAPDTLSMLMIGIMYLILAVGFLVGIMPMTMFYIGFQNGRRNIDRALEVNTDSEWVAINQIEFFFHQGTLDHWFREYKEKVKYQQEQDLIISDIETIFNEEALALRCWQNVISQIPGTLTAVGLLGTFLGMITGITSIGFSSVDAAISSISILLEGIKMAFYTSIVGVIFSILFNISYKFLWNCLLRSLGLFVEEFHKKIQPDAEEQLLLKQQEEMELILERLERIPKDRGFSLSQMDKSTQIVPGNETDIMAQIQNGLQNGEFIFWVQPRYNLMNRRIVGGEALMRWQHAEHGLISPGEFIPIVERNGYIVKLDQHIWELVCKTIRRWIDSGIRPLPIAVNVSKTDILSIDVPSFFEKMVKKYRIPPQNLEIEIAYNAYENYTDSVLETESRLRQSGFKVIVENFNGELVTMNLLKNSTADVFKMDLRYMEKDRNGLEKPLELAVSQARKLHRNVAAEGIENTEQLTLLQKFGCMEGQGYYLYKPVDCSEFEILIQRG